MQKETILQFVFSWDIILQVLIATVFLLSAFIPVLQWSQPVVFLAMTPMTLSTAQDSFYALGAFVIAVLLLFRLGFYETRRGVKLFLSLGYLYAWELFFAIRMGRELIYSLTPIFFITAFLMILYFAYKEKLMVYLKEPKPKLSLDEKGLSPAEKTYVMAVLSGKNHKEIAVDYEVSDSTVRNTISRAYQKLEVSDKAGLAVLAERFEIMV